LINCADFVAELDNYLDGDVAAAVRVQLEHHIAHCKTCTVLVDSTRKTLKILTENGLFDLPREAFESIADEIMARIRTKEK
jgi:anti-sigma factor RsiW